MICFFAPTLCRAFELDQVLNAVNCRRYLPTTRTTITVVLVGGRAVHTKLVVDTHLANLRIRKQRVQGSLATKVTRTNDRVLALDKLCVVSPDTLRATQAREAVLSHTAIGVDPARLELDVQSLGILLIGNVGDDRGIGTVVTNV